jgi:SAM-dependent methyltransferase
MDEYEDTIAENISKGKKWAGQKKNPTNERKQHKEIIQNWFPVPQQRQNETIDKIPSIKVDAKANPHLVWRRKDKVSWSWKRKRDDTTPDSRNRFGTIDQQTFIRDCNDYLVNTSIISASACRILDLGCGSGFTSFYLHDKAEEGSIVCGIDTKDDVDYADIRYGKSLHLRSGLYFQAAEGSVDGEHGSLETIPPPIRSATFADRPRMWDVIVSHSLLYRIPAKQHSVAIKVMIHSLSKGGFLMVRLPGHVKNQSRKKIIGSMEEAGLDTSYVKFFKANHVASFMNKEFANRCIQNINHDVIDDKYLQQQNEAPTCSVRYTLLIIQKIKKIK